MSDSIELSINERVNSSLYSDVINSYVDINAVVAKRNIVPGSYKETVVQATDQTLATLNAAGGQTLFTRLKLTPQVRNATLAQLAQIYFQYVIPANSLAVVAKKYANAATAEDEATDQCDTLQNNACQDTLRFKLFYDTGFSIASMVQLCLSADAKISTENFNYQQSLLTLNSIPDYATDGSNTESTLKSLIENPTSSGVGSGIVDVNLAVADNSSTHYWVKINKDIGIEGLIDLNKGNPLFHNFPIITRNFGELYLRLYMENFLRELKVVYLNKQRFPQANATGNLDLKNKELKFQSDVVQIGSTGVYHATLVNTNDSEFAGVVSIASTNGKSEDSLPYARLPADKPDFVYLNGDLWKVRLVNAIQNGLNDDKVQIIWKNISQPIYALNNISWKRFEIRKVEFDIEDYEDIKASQGKAGSYKCPVHLWRSKNFDQTNAASSSANALQTTLNAPNIDRLFICQPFSRDYPTFLPPLATTDINPQIHNNPVLPRTEDCLNSRTCERIYNVFVDTDKYSAPRDLIDSTNVPTLNKKLWLKSANTYGGAGALEKIQRGIDQIPGNSPLFLPNKFSYALELNEGGCFRRGFNSVLNGNYSPTVPINLQQSVQTSDDIYFSATYDTQAGSQGSDISNSWSGFCSVASYGPFTQSGAVASVHCLCDYILGFQFDPYGNLTDFGVSEYNGQGA